MHKYLGSQQNIKAIILTGSHDFGRYSREIHLPTPLWPVAGKPILERLLVHLADRRVKQVVICSNVDNLLLKESIHDDNNLNLKFLYEQLPVGTAGCIRDATRDEVDSLLLIFPANIISPPNIVSLINTHYQSRADLTIVFNPSYRNGKSLGEPAEIYVCESNVLQYIPRDGYFDIKEGLIPEMLRAGKTVQAAILPNHVGNFRNAQGYVCAIADYLESTSKPDVGLKLHKHSNGQNVWVGANTNIDPSARIYGPAIIMDGVRICENAVIFGPTIVGRNVNIGKDSVLANSVLWDNAQVCSNCKIQRCLIDCWAVVPSNTIVEEESIAFKPRGLLVSSVNRAIRRANNKVSKLQRVLQAHLVKTSERTPDWLQLHKTKIAPVVAAGLVLIAFLWSYWPGLVDLWNMWRRSDEYSAGLLVPFLAVYILWSRRQDIAKCAVRPFHWGMLAFMGAQAVRLFGLFFMYSSAEKLSIEISIAALVLLLFGWQLFRKVFTVLLFLCLMLPWPNRIQTAVTLPLQHWATSSAVFCLEVMGYEVVQEGNIIHVGSATVAVAEACNGLRMVTAFFVISGLVVLLVNRAWWEKLIVFASSLPIALLCNTTRLAITALAFTVVSGEYWEKIFHDFGGYAMMPLALAIVLMKLWLITRLTTLPTKHEPIIVTRQNR